MFTETRKLITLIAVMACAAAILLCAVGIRMVFGHATSLVANLLSIFI